MTAAASGLRRDIFAKGWADWQRISRRKCAIDDWRCEGDGDRHDGGEQVMFLHW